MNSVIKLAGQGKSGGFLPASQVAAQGYVADSELMPGYTDTTYSLTRTAYTPLRNAEIKLTDQTLQQIPDLRKYVLDHPMTRQVLPNLDKEALDAYDALKAPLQ